MKTRSTSHNICLSRGFHTGEREREKIKENMKTMMVIDGKKGKGERGEREYLPFIEVLLFV